MKSATSFSGLYLYEMNLDLRGETFWKRMGKMEGTNKRMKIRDLLRIESEVRVKIFGTRS